MSANRPAELVDAEHDLVADEHDLVADEHDLVADEQVSAEASLSAPDPTDHIQRTTIHLPRSPRYLRLAPSQPRDPSCSRQGVEWFDSVLHFGAELELAYFQHYPKFHHHFPIRHRFEVGDAAVVAGVDGVGIVAGAVVAFSGISCDLRLLEEVVVRSVPGSRKRLSPTHRHVPSHRCYFEDLGRPNRSSRRQLHAFAPKSPLGDRPPPYYLDGDSIRIP